jgi:hypothetical protein
MMNDESKPSDLNHVSNPKSIPFCLMNVHNAGASMGKLFSFGFGLNPALKSSQHIIMLLSCTAIRFYGTQYINIFHRRNPEAWIDERPNLASKIFENGLGGNCGGSSGAKAGEGRQQPTV